MSRAGVRRAGIRLVGDRVAAIDVGAHQVRLQTGRALPFDRLVVAPGIRFLWHKPEGYDAAAAQSMPHAWQAGDQTQRLAAQLRAMDDGGVVAISVPSGLMRCPPAPYERASLIAYFLARHKPRSKLLILDSNNHFPRQDLFTGAWQSLYPGIIEWIASTQDGAVVRVDTANMTLYTANAAHRVAVANVIPPQAPGQIAADAGLASDHGWCPVAPHSFESQLIPGVHVIGDACIADAMPKSGSAAVSQARQCAGAIVALLAGREVPELVDGGGLVGSPVDTGTRILAPALRARRRSRLRVVALSHPHPDHFTGLASGLDGVQVGALWDTGQGRESRSRGAIAHFSSTPDSIESRSFGRTVCAAAARKAEHGSKSSLRAQTRRSTAVRTTTRWSCGYRTGGGLSSW